jgi:hypothetical protein
MTIQSPKYSQISFCAHVKTSCTPQKYTRLLVKLEDQKQMLAQKSKKSGPMSNPSTYREHQKKEVGIVTSI